MANYFKWRKGKRDEVEFYSEKPRSRSLDPRSLELSGIRLVAEKHLQQQLKHYDKVRIRIRIKKAFRCVYCELFARLWVFNMQMRCDEEVLSVPSCLRYDCLRVCVLQKIPCLMLILYLFVIVYSQRYRSVQFRTFKSVN